MGEYFDWVNIRKKEFITPSDFDYGSKFHESRHKDSDVLHALYELLSDRWKGDPLVFLGDDINIQEDTSVPLLQELQRQTGGTDHIDFIYENYRNVSCLFKKAETEVRENIIGFIEDVQRVSGFRNPNEYGIDIRNPFAGLFSLHGKLFRYVINHTKKVYYSLNETRILYPDGEICDYVDPLPLLLGYGRSTQPGIWLGDIVGVSDEISNDYSLIAEIRLDG